MLAEVNVAVMRERDEYRLVHGRGHSPVTISLTDMAARTLGEAGPHAWTLTPATAARPHHMSTHVY